MDKFEVLAKMSANSLFIYDLANDTLEFTGNYNNRLHAKRLYENFVGTISTNPLVEGDSKRGFIKLLKDTCSQGHIVSKNLSLLTHEDKYETFCVKTFYLHENNEILGFCRNIEFILRADADSLTGLYNRSGIEKQLDNILKQTTKDSITALVMIDLDNFKMVNDTHGHLVGDEVLRDISQILIDCFDKNSLISRIGGDEFLICCSLMPNIKELIANVNKLIENILAYGGNRFGISASAGIAIASQCMPFQKLYSNADVAAYAAKKAGKNTYRIYDESMESTKYINEESVSNYCDNTRNKQAVEVPTINYLPLITAITEINNKDTSVKTKIEESSKLIANFFDIDTTYACCFYPDGEGLLGSYYYSRSTEVNTTDTQNIFLKKKEFIKNFDERGIFFCCDVKKLNEPIRSEYIKEHITSCLQILIYDENDKVIGFLGANSLKKRLWNQTEVDILLTISKLITKTIRELHSNSLQALKKDLLRVNTKSPSRCIINKIKKQKESYVS